MEEHGTYEHKGKSQESYLVDVAQVCSTHKTTWWIWVFLKCYSLYPLKPGFSLLSSPIPLPCFSPCLSLCRFSATARKDAAVGYSYNNKSLVVFEVWIWTCIPQSLLWAKDAEENWHLVDFLRRKGFSVEQMENLKILVKTLENRFPLSQSGLLEKIKLSWVWPVEAFNCLQQQFGMKGHFNWHNCSFPEAIWRGFTMVWSFCFYINNSLRSTRNLQKIHQSTCVFA